MKKIKYFGRYNPIVFSIEPTHGCNLRCGHCNCRLDPLPKKYNFMETETWVNTWNIIKKVAPTCRIDLCIGGEPTLNPNLYEFLKIARRTSPLSQIQITTNGTQLLNGKYNYRDLLKAGENIIYTDMYGPKEKFKQMAKESGAYWYEYYNNNGNVKSPWTYHGADLKMVVLQEQPENWPESRKKAGLLGTWYNHLDWEAAKEFNLYPVTNAPNRRCNQPFQYANIDSKGNYLLCCQDNTGETSGMFGNVSDGIDGFINFWFGKKMQEYRRNVSIKNRKGNDQCSRCCITFSRCDYILWDKEILSKYWNGTKWMDF